MKAFWSDNRGEALAASQEFPAQHPGLEVSSEDPRKSLYDGYKEACIARFEKAPSLILNNGYEPDMLFKLPSDITEEMQATNSPLSPEQMKEAYLSARRITTVSLAIKAAKQRDGSAERYQDVISKVRNELYADDPAVRKLRMPEHDVLCDTALTSVVNTIKYGQQKSGQHKETVEQHQETVDRLKNIYSGLARTENGLIIDTNPARRVAVQGVRALANVSQETPTLNLQQAMSNLEDSYKKTPADNAILQRDKALIHTLQEAVTTQFLIAIQKLHTKGVSQQRLAQVQSLEALCEHLELAIDPRVAVLVQQATDAVRGGQDKIRDQAALRTLTEQLAGIKVTPDQSVGSKFGSRIVPAAVAAAISVGVIAVGGPAAAASTGTTPRATQQTTEPTTTVAIDMQGRVKLPKQSVDPNVNIPSEIGNMALTVDRSQGPTANTPDQPVSKQETITEPIAIELPDTVPAPEDRKLEDIQASPGIAKPTTQEEMRKVSVITGDSAMKRELMRGVMKAGEEATENSTRFEKGESVAGLEGYSEVQKTLDSLITELDARKDKLDKNITTEQRASPENNRYWLITEYARLIAESPEIMADKNFHAKVSSELKSQGSPDESFISTFRTFMENSPKYSILFSDKEKSNFTKEQLDGMRVLVTYAASGVVSDADLKVMRDKITEYSGVDSTSNATSEQEQNDQAPNQGSKSEDKGRNNKGNNGDTNRDKGSSRDDNKERELSPNKYNTGSWGKTWDFFTNDKDLRLSTWGAGALIGGFGTETGGTMDPRIIQGFEYSDTLPDRILNKLGYGLNQATSQGRQEHMKQVAKRMGLPEGTLAVQHQYIKEELLDYPELLRLLRQDAPNKLWLMTKQVEIQYERAGVDAWESRFEYAKKVIAANEPGQKGTKHKDEAGNRAKDDQENTTLREQILAYQGVDSIVSETDTGTPLPDKLGNVVYYSQWDKKWGNEQYNWPGGSDRTITSSGCGPSTQAMVISTLSRERVTPLQMARWNQAHGYRVNGGTAHAAFTESARAYGLKADFIDDGVEGIRNAVRNGKIVIVNGTDSDRSTPATDAGHIYLVRGLTQNGNFIVSDANSITKSLTVYDPATIANVATVAVAVWK